MLTVSTTNFKANNQTDTIFSTKRSREKVPMDYNDDSLELMLLEKDLQKKQKRQENLQKWGVYGTCAIGGALVLQVMLSLYSMYKAGKGDGMKNLKMVWDDIAKKTDFPDLKDDCVNDKVRKFWNKSCKGRR